MIIKRQAKILINEDLSLPLLFTHLAPALDFKGLLLLSAVATRHALSTDLRQPSFAVDFRQGIILKCLSEEWVVATRHHSQMFIGGVGCSDKARLVDMLAIANVC